MLFSDFKKAFEDQFNSDVDFNPEDRFRDSSGWDSMTAMMLVAFLDEKYSIKIEMDDFAKINTVQELYDYILNNDQRN